MKEFFSFRALVKLAKILFVVGVFLIAKYKGKKRNKALERAYELIENGKFEDATWHIDKYLEENNKDAIAYSLKGECLELLGKRDEARESFEKSIELDKKNYESLSALGYINYQDERFEEAIDLYKRAEKIDKTAEIYKCLGLAYYMTGDKSKFESYMKKSLRLEEDDKDEVYNELIAYYKSEGNYEMAEKYENKIA